MFHSARIRGWLTVLAMVAGGAAEARADVVYANFGPDLGFNVNLFNSYSVVNPGNGSASRPFIVASSFAMPAGGDFTLTSVSLPLEIVSASGNGDVEMQIRQAVPSPLGQPEPGPGIILNFPVIVDRPSVLTGTPDDNFVIQGGQTYFIVLQIENYAPDTSPFTAAWYLPSTVTSSTESYSESGANSYYTIVQSAPPALRLTGTPIGSAAVSEPGSLASMGMGGLGLMGYLRRRARGHVLR